MISETAAPTGAVADDPASRPAVTLLPARHKRAEAGHPWIYANEVRMDAAARGARTRRSRHRATRRRQRARGGDVQPALLTRRASAGPRRWPADRPAVPAAPTRTGAAAARAAVRRALLPPRPCRG